MYERLLDLKNLIKRKSVFLFGPRQTGKSYYLKQNFKKALYYDLLKTDVFFRLSAKPSIIREEILAATNFDVIVIDEIQKIPSILDEVHYLIEEHDLIFILTGSSARKLKRGSANMLGGRALIRNLFPLVSKEIPNFDLLRVLNFGSLPPIYSSPDPFEDLEAYVGTYLKEEIQAEGLVRKLEHFSKFLNLSALCDAQMLNFSSIGSDLGMPAKTIREYFRILEDTLIGSLLEPYTKTIKRKAVSTAKFYFFDIGVSNVLAGRHQITAKTELFGKAFEHFIFLELKAYLHYTKDRRPLTYWRSKSGFEVDFLVGDEIAIEVKGTEMVSQKHTKGLNKLSEDVTLKQKIIVSLDPRERLLDDIVVYPYREFLTQLWNHQLL